MMAAMSRRSRDSGGPNKPVAIFATILVVAGVAAVVAVSSEFRSATTPASLKNPTNALQASQPGPYASGTILLVNDSAVTLMQLNATSERVTPEQFTARFKGAALPTEGVDAANGSKVSFHLPTDSTSSTARFLSPDRAREAQLVTTKNGATAISIAQSSETPQTIVLRDAQGHALQDVSLLGWLTDSTFAVSGISTSTPAVTILSTDGDVRRSVSLPTSTLWAEVHGGEVWYATGVVGEGIESTPHGPSELHRISADGTDTLAARDELHVFLTVIVGMNGQIAATTDDGQSFLLTVGDSTSRHVLGQLRPLLFLPDGELLVRDGFDMDVYDPTRQVSRKLGVVPEGEVNVFFLP
jgi:hypothetical protein